MMALTSCFYVSVRPIPEEGAIEEPKEGFGWLSRQIEVMEPPAYGKQCAWYTAEERSMYFDSMWNAGLAMALITCVLGLVVMSIVLCTCCVAFQLKTFDGLFWTCVVCFVAQALTFLSWGSDLCEDYECTWSSGTGMNLTAAMMWVWAANMIKSFPEALPPRTRGNRRNRDQDDDDDDDGAGDVYLSNRNNAPHEMDDGVYRDDDYGDWDNNNSNDQGDGYYDEDGKWVANDYDDRGTNYDSYDEFENNNCHRSNRKKGGYSDYDNESDGNWAEESDADNFDENAPMDAPQTKPARIAKKKKKMKDPAAVSSSSMSSFDNDDWDDEQGSFRY